jgi:hypothetical protein
MRTRHLLLLFAVGLAAAPLLSTRVATAQISDSERQAARQLYGDGVALQQAGHYAEALDKFTRAQRVIFAHTNLQHIGECQTALGKWVEAAEAYRLAIRTDTGGNPAFQEAQQTCQQNLNALQPRIPQVKIDVTPKDAPDLQVQVDGQAVNPALLDVPMPLDPGAHKIVAFAPGYTSSEQNVTLQEKDSKAVALTLVATGGVTYTNPGTGATTGLGGAKNGGATTGAVPPPPPAQTAPAGGPDQGRWAPPRPVSRSTGSGILLGLGLGVDIPSGDLSGGAGGGVLGSSSSNPMSDVAKAGGTFGLSGLARFGRFGVGVFYQYSGYGQGDAFSRDVSNTPSTQTLTTNAHSHYLGAVVSYISNPAGVGFYGELGFGYRIFSTSEKTALVSDSSQSIENDATFTAPEFLMGAGVWIHAGNWLRIIPKANVGLGTFNNFDFSCSATGSQMCPAGASSSGSVPNTSGHAFFLLTVNGYYEIPL